MADVAELVDDRGVLPPQGKVGWQHELRILIARLVVEMDAPMAAGLPGLEGIDAPGGDARGVTAPDPVSLAIHIQFAVVLVKVDDVRRSAVAEIETRVQQWIPADPVENWKRLGAAGNHVTKNYQKRI